MDAGRGILTKEKAIELLRDEWQKARSAEASSRNLETFLASFYAGLAAKFSSELSIDFFRTQFLVSEQQACLRQDVLDSKVTFRPKAEADFGPIRDGNSFDEISLKMFERMFKRRRWSNYDNLKNMFLSVKGKNQQINCGGVSLMDILKMMLRRNILDLKQRKPMKKKKKMKKTQGILDSIKALANNFIAHLNSLGASKPKDRDELKRVFERFVQNIPDKPQDFESVDFKDITGYMKTRRIIKFSSGKGIIEYKKQGSLATDQYYGKNRQQRSASSQRNEKPTVQRSQDNDRQDKGTGISHKDLLDLLKKLSTSQHGIRITSDLDDEDANLPGVIDFGVSMEGERVTAKITISKIANETTDEEIKFTGCYFLELSKWFTVDGGLNVHPEKMELTITNGSSHEITVYFDSKEIGRHRTSLVFSFKNVSNGQCFGMNRFVRAETIAQSMDELMPQAPYKHRNPRQISRDASKEIVRGVPPNGMSNMGTAVVPLGEYRIPNEIRYNVNSGDGSVSGKLKDSLEVPVQGPGEYREKFHALLYLEELQMEVDIRRYDMEDAEMKKERNLLSLEVPGLAEGKPSLIIGDKVYVTVQGGNRLYQQKSGQKEFQGYIHQVERDRILLKFHSSFHGNFIPGQKHAVRFSFNRTTLRLQHRAIDIACNLIFQNVFHSIDLSWNTRFQPLYAESVVNGIRCFDRKIESNLEQMNAVKNIVAGSSRPFPYIVFGPPGTGKTVTCVEAMKQILKLNPQSRILACAPSNSAADLILHRLLNPCPIPRTQLHRINAFSRQVNSLPRDMNIREFCKIKDNVFEFPTLEELKSYRVIVSTMTTAGRLVSMNLDNSFFTHVFLDECGQAVEPEALIPVAGLLNPENKFGGQVILAGDPKQLGPVLQSPVACENGLQVSTLERLMTHGPIYQRSEDDNDSDDSHDSVGSLSDEEDSDGDDLSSRIKAMSMADGSNDYDDEDDDEEEEDRIETGKYNEKFITKLVNNYRSHPAILQKPNQLFYSNELIPKADEFKVNSLCQWDELPAKRFPIIFHGVEGEDMREGSSPSFFNPFEVVEVIRYVQLLLGNRSLGVTPDEIGVISPYRKQVAKIRQWIKKKMPNEPNIEQMKVGSVEEFQGQERRIIIISTVRSNKEFWRVDSKFRLGFLKNPKRFNVAVTRAQALLIVVGNPFILSEDYHWKSLLNHCLQNGGYKGCKYEHEFIGNQESLLPNMINRFSSAFSGIFDSFF